MNELIALFSETQTYISLATLTAMEIVLGIDNIVFIAVIAARLPQSQQAKARFIGLSLALVIRIVLLLCIVWIIGLTEPVLSIARHDFSGRDLILLAGGLFLLFKSTKEIHHKFEDAEEGPGAKGQARFGSVVFQILLIDIVFSFDSIITAVGLVKHVPIMIIAVIISMGVMLAFSGAISRFIAKHPTIKMLALSFLLLIGTMLVAEAFHVEIPRGYVYFAMAFSLFVEMLNIKLKSKTSPA